MTTTEVHAVVTDFVHQLTDSAATAVPPTARLDDLGIDSLNLVDLLFKLERQFDVSIPDEALPLISTVADLAEFVATAER